MKIRYLAHASFLITTESGTRIVTDPVDSSLYDGQLSYKAFNEKADIVTISHEHKDHSGIGVVKGNPIIIRGNGKFIAKDVEFYGVETFHDDKKGEIRGKNTVFIISADDLTIAHMGDLGHILNGDQASEIGSVDVALIPIGGFYTINAEEAAEVIKQINAKIIIPMHYKTKKCSFPIGELREFLGERKNVDEIDSGDLEIYKDSLPTEPRIIVLNPTL